MSVRYWVLFPDELAARDGLRMPSGLRFTVPADLRVPPSARDALVSPVRIPGAHWQEIEDDGAGPELTGRRVELVLRLEEGCPVVAERRLAAVTG